jgi:glycosyltransferase involved in cell wall biosynthesis
MKTKILYICYEDLSGYNGAIRHVTEIVKGLARRGHRIDLCVPILRKKPSKLSMGQNVRLRYIPTVPVQGVRPLSYVLLSLLYFPFLYLLVRPDIVYCRDIKFTVLPVFLAKIFKVPCILEVNGLTDEAKRVKKVAPWIFSILDTFHRWNVRKSDRIVTVTRGIKKEISRRYGVNAERISIITNGVDLKRFCPAPRGEARKSVGLSQSHQYVGFVGGLFPWHGLDQLVMAAPYVLKAKPRTRFVIVGTGLMYAPLRATVEQRKLNEAFVFTGSVPFNAVPNYVNSFNVCVVFFKRVRKDPGDPIKLYEYLACGRPVVASNVTGYGDTVESIGAGLSVNSEDPIATADAILKLLRNNRQTETMGRKGFDMTQVYFGWEKKAEETEQLMSEIIRRR